MENTIRRQASHQETEEIKETLFEQRRTRARLLEQVAKTFDNLTGVQYLSLIEVERMSLEDLKALPSKGTGFEPVVHGLNQLGLRVAPTVGAVMDRLNISKKDVEFILGDFAQGPTISAKDMAGHLRWLAQPSFADKFCLVRRYIADMFGRAESKQQEI
jgi:hypothetical protein